MVKTFITVLCIAWVIQIILGILQIKRFNSAYIQLAQNNHFIGVGRSSGRFTPKVVMIIGLNEQKIITDTLIMQGITVFSKPQKMLQLHGKPIGKINVDDVFPTQKRHQQALSAALKTNR